MRIDDKLAKEILDLRAKEYGVGSISTETGVSRSTIRRFLKSQPNFKPVIIKKTKEFELEVIKLKKTLKCSEISKKLSVSITCIKDILKRNNVDIHDKMGVPIKHSEEQAHQRANERNFKIVKITSMASSAAIEIQCHCGNYFTCRVSDFLRKDSRGVYSCGCVKSQYQSELAKFVRTEIKLDFINNDRTAIAPLELDIYIPSKQVAIEFNGLYFHSEKFLDKNYHKQKYEAAKTAGIRLISIFEDEWASKPAIVKEYIKSILLPKTNKIGARKLKLNYGKLSDVSEFLNKNHIQGAKGNSAIWLEFNGEILACVTLSKIYNKKSEIERYCVDRAWDVQGGFKRLIAAIFKNPKIEDLVTFADLRWSAGGTYLRNGWTLSHIVRPNYYYLQKHLKQRWHKSNFRLSKLRKRFGEKECAGLTEREIAKKMGYLRIYDCGKQCWKIKNPNIACKPEST